MTNPNGCRLCGIDQRGHARQWAPIMGVHQWLEPGQAMILERMRRRRDNRLNAEPTAYHCTTEWSGGPDDSEGDEYCADCRTHCAQYWRIQTRLARRRYQLQLAAGYVPEEPW